MLAVTAGTGWIETFSLPAFVALWIAAVFADRSIRRVGRSEPRPRRWSTAAWMLLVGGVVFLHPRMRPHNVLLDVVSSRGEPRSVPCEELGGLQVQTRSLGMADMVILTSELRGWPGRGVLVEVLGRDDLHAHALEVSCEGGALQLSCPGIDAWSCTLDVAELRDGSWWSPVTLRSGKVLHFNPVLGAWFSVLLWTCAWLCRRAGARAAIAEKARRGS